MTYPSALGAYWNEYGTYRMGITCIIHGCHMHMPVVLHAYHMVIKLSHVLNLSQICALSTES